MLYIVEFPGEVTEEICKKAKKAVKDECGPDTKVIVLGGGAKLSAVPWFRETSADADERS